MKSIGSQFKGGIRATILTLLLGSLAACGGSNSPIPGIYVPKTRTYYIAAEEVAWDYAPSDMNVIKGAAWTADEEVFVANDDDRIGKEYIKAVYVEYTDETFTTERPVAPEWTHKGILGPIIRAAVGDTIVVVFKNNASLPYSVHPHGVLYDKANEGAGSNDGTSGDDLLDDSVMPGATYTYTWEVPPSAGPSNDDESSVVWLYHSHVMAVADENAGLVGAIVITDPFFADENAVPMDVDREVVSYFTVFDENASHYLDDNITTYAGNPGSVDPDDDDFIESNLMHAINGYVYGNGPTPTMNAGERVRWYLLSLGTEVDLHTPHWHGNTAVYDGHRTDVVELLPASMKVADLGAENPGRWLFHCHVNDHILAGMVGQYDVMP